MTDSAQLPVTSLPPADLAAPPTPPTDAGVPLPAGADPNQSPLDVLDQILKEAQVKAEAASAEKTTRDAAEQAAERERQRQLDLQRVEAERQQIAQMKQSPQYQATQEQKQAQEQQDAAHQQAMDGMEIVQLTHTKL